MKRTLFGAMLGLIISQSLSAQDQEAHYILVFEATWSAQTHPDQFPPNPHFSGLIGGVHGNQVRFWENGALATPGIESMAETGSKTLLRGEVQNAINAGTALSVINGPGIGLSPGAAEVEFDVNQGFSEVTVVSMIAPSPDWYVGVTGLDLFQNGAWVDRLTVDLLPWDSGTDSGTSYLSRDQDTNPPEPIHLITTPPVGNGVSLGTFTFIRCEVGETVPYGTGFPGTNGVPSISTSSDPNLGSSFSIDIGNSRGVSTLSLFIAGFSPASIPGAWGGDLLVSPSLTLSLTLPGAGMALPVSLPSDIDLCGLSLFIQSIQMDPGASGGVSNSAGLELILGQ